MRLAEVYRNKHLVGTLIQYSPQSYEFAYTNEWFANDSLPAISLTLP